MFFNENDNEIYLSFICNLVNKLTIIDFDGKIC